MCGPAPPFGPIVFGPAPKFKMSGFGPAPKISNIVFGPAPSFPPGGLFSEIRLLKVKDIRSIDEPFQPSCEQI